MTTINRSIFRTPAVDLTIKQALENVADVVNELAGVAVVLPATGVATTDTNNINAAIVTAGTGGVVVFPPNQTYRTHRRPGYNLGSYPAKMIGNGSTLKLANEVTTTVASGTITSASTVINVADASGFSVGDWIGVSDLATNYSYSQAIQSINANAITLTAALGTFCNGSSCGVGATVYKDDHCLKINYLADNLKTEISGFIFDGNSSNRVTARNWGANTLLYLSNSSAPTTHKQCAWIHHNVFQDAPGDAYSSTDVSNVIIHDNHFKNIFGMGTHPGGSGYNDNFIVANNTFFNCSQTTNATTPTATNYGHITGQGVISSSNGPKRCVVAGNVVDTSESYGLDALNNSYHTDYTVSGNVFYNCKRGGFHMSATGSSVSVTGNVIDTCGHDTDYVSGQKETTSLNGMTASRSVISGNIFKNSVLSLWNDSAEILVTGNYFDAMLKTYGGTNEQGALQLFKAGGGVGSISITDNQFRLPRTLAEYTAVTTSLICVVLNSVANGVLISGNKFVGGICGIYSNISSGATSYDLAIVGNQFTDQYSEGSTVWGGITFNQGGGSSNYYGLSINNNSFALTAIQTGNVTPRWCAINAHSAMVARGGVISGNSVRTELTPATTNIGFKMQGACSGIQLSNNSVWMNAGTPFSLTNWTANNIAWGNVIGNNNSSSNFGSAVVAFSTTAGAANQVLAI